MHAITGRLYDLHGILLVCVKVPHACADCVIVRMGIIFIVCLHFSLVNERPGIVPGRVELDFEFDAFIQPVDARKI